MLSALFIILSCALWALDTLIRYPLIHSGVSAASITFSEHGLLVIFSLPFLWKMRSKWMNIGVGDLLCFVFVGGIGSALTTISFTRAMSLINPSLVILLQKFQPLVALLLARVLLKEPMKKEFLGWAALCLGGGFLISYEDLIPHRESFELSWNLLDQRSLLGYGLALIAVVGWGANTVLGKMLIRQNYSETEIMSGRFFFGFLFLLPLLGGNQWPLTSTGDLKTWGLIFLMVLGSGVMAMYFYYRGLKGISARLCTLLEMFFPFFAVLVNWIFLDAALAPIQILGALLLIISSTIIQIRHY